MITVFFSAIAVIIGVMFLRNRPVQIVQGNWVKTLVYFVAVVIVGVFFYKTNQVATLYSQINIEAYKASFLKGHTPVIIDSIREILIANHYASESFNDAIREVDDSKFTDVSLVIESPRHADYIIKEKASRDSIVGMCNHMEIPPNHLGRMYQVIYGSATLPNFFPIHIQRNETKPIEFRDTYIRKSSYTKNEHDSEGTLSILTDKGFVALEGDFKPNGLQKFHSKYATLLACDNLHTNAALKYDGSIEGSIFDFFTAADISQYIMGLSVYSDCPIDAIQVKYDIPIEISNDENGITSGTFAFWLHSGVLGDILKGHVHHFHVKLPTMANVQLVRSFILTTILTALFTLFLASLGDLLYCWRKNTESFIHKSFANDNSTYSSNKKAEVNNREKLYKISRIIIMLLYSFCILYGCYLVYIDEPFVMSQEKFESFSSTFVYITIFLSIVLLVLYIRMKRKLL